MPDKFHFSVKPKRYLTGLDGLRAIAVIAIIIYHLNPLWLPGGFLGVDTFFVISGYLITSLLIHEYQSKGSIDLIAFWIRRIKRLIPAVFFLIGVVILYTLIFEPQMIKTIKHDSLAALFYVSNWWYIFEDVSYFEASEPKPLMHLWSLAIEEQFYIIWPVIFVLLLKFGRSNKTMPIAVLLMTFVSLFLMTLFMVPDMDNSRVYFGTDTRAHTILLGVLLAFIWPPFNLKTETPKRYQQVIDTIGITSLIILILFMMFTKDYSNWLYAGGLFFVTLLTLPAIAASVHPVSKLGHALSNPVMLWIGTRSYSLYLWHYPIIVFMNMHYVAGQIPLHVILLQVALTCIAAELSFRFVETPIRKQGFNFFKPAYNTSRALIVKSTVSVILVAGLLVTLLGIFDHLHKDVNKQSSFNTEDGTMQFSSTPKSVAWNIKKNHKQFTDDKARIAQEEADKEEQAELEKEKQDFASEYLSHASPLFIGDSIMVNIGSNIQYRIPNAVINGEVGRQMYQAIEISRTKYPHFNSENENIVLELGTNGDFSLEQLEDFIQTFNRANIYLVTIRVPRDWEGNVNKKIHTAGEEFENVTVIDWYKASEGHVEYFEPDGIHLNADGVEAMVDLIIDHILEQEQNKK
ncbi:acyltransferase family protein [Nosocomiicoccus sp. HMSC059G07]|uniref:acyltransferase family protein n=1 Tax=Nosocomiicoccus sp. HMSC059G07 TaxID=1739531 RepID=UPI0008A3ED84|nr:acyltransferase family protein [Nosocomiicoccus sp. HMSC059G07]OFO56363.1 hypothetical protein HMPREF3029_00400 [Nosocomiicoccus sp. HMSC059G07]